mmetsp:Transcript_6050/g.13219  ORF Transcript_6050/g.13219 Transcript_6050/m.13219 type:complete len:240 (+) Transcript_6050:207-926(+)
MIPVNTNNSSDAATMVTDRFNNVSTPKAVRTMRRSKSVRRRTQKSTTENSGSSKPVRGTSDTRSTKSVSGSKSVRTRRSKSISGSKSVRTRRSKSKSRSKSVRTRRSKSISRSRTSTPSTVGTHVTASSSWGNTTAVDGIESRGDNITRNCDNISIIGDVSSASATPPSAYNTAATKGLSAGARELLNAKAEAERRERERLTPSTLVIELSDAAVERGVNSKWKRVTSGWGRFLCFTHH